MSSSIHNTPDRKILPQLQKHNNYVNSQISKPFQLLNKDHKQPLIEFKDNDLNKMLIEWKKNKSTALAGDILSMAIIENQTDEISEITKFLLKKHPKDIVLKWVLSNTKDERSIKKEIDYNNQRLSIEPKDSITWTDQALNYLELGDYGRTLKAIETAISINKDSSFIVRNASRLFNLLGDENRAISVLKQSEHYKYDPNILSAEIAFSQLEKRHTKGTLYGSKLLLENNLTDRQYSELAGALATSEYLKDNFKKSEKLFDRCLLDPNVNSLTQSLFYKQNPIPNEKLDLFSDSNEIMYRRYSQDSQFKKSLNHSLLWIKDEPYSSRPYNSAAYMSGSVLGDYGKAVGIIQNLKNIEIELKGEIDEEIDMGIRNDLAYYLLKSNKIDEAAKYLEPLREEVENRSLNNRRQHVAIATLGLLAYKTGNPELGKKMYRTTIKEFSKLKNKHNVQSAFLNFFNEEISHEKDRENLFKLKNELDKLIPVDSENDIIYRKARALSNFKIVLRGL